MTWKLTRRDLLKAGFITADRHTRPLLRMKDGKFDHVCVSCHVESTGAKPLVRSDFRP
jgi:nitrate reductase cytochrome c-type subunit